MKYSLYLLTLVSLISIKPEFLFAQWVQTNGPYGAGNVPSIVASPGGTLFAGIATRSGTLFAGTEDDRVYRSSNNGKSWTEADAGLVAGYVFCVAIASDDSALYAGTDNGVFRSTNEGVSWTSMGLENYYIMRLAVSRNDSTLLAATANYGMFRYNSNSSTWEPSDSGTENVGGVRALIAGANDSTFFAYEWGAVRSTNGGISWTPINYDSSGYYSVMSMAVSSNDSTIFIGSSNRGVLRLTDNGTKWTSTSLGLEKVHNIQSLAVSPDGSTVYAGTIAGLPPNTTGKDHGATFRYRGGKWTEIDSSGIEAQSFLILPDGSVFAGSNYSGIYRMTDNGTNWIEADSGIVENEVYSLAVTPDGSEIAAGTSQGLFITGNSGASWTRIGLNTLDLGNSTIGPVAFPDGGDLYAGTSNGKLFHFTRNGAGWVNADTLSFGRDIYFLAPTPAGKLFAGVDSNYNVETFSSNKWALTDSLLDNSGVDHVAVSPDGKTIFAVNTYYGSAYLSTDGGSTWSQKPNIDSTGVYINNPTAFAITDAGAIFAGTPEYSGYITFHEGSVFRSTDSGESWEEMNVDSNATFSDFTSIVVSKDGMIFAGTAENGIYVSTDDGENWAAVNNGLADDSINCIAISSGGSDLLAGTKDGGVWRRPMSELNSVAASHPATPSHFILEQNYPNPFNPSTTISYSLPEPSNVRIEVFNVLGERVATLVNGYERAGSHKVEWNAERFASGVYLYRLNAGRFLITKKMMLLK